MARMTGSIEHQSNEQRRGLNSTSGIVGRSRSEMAELTFTYGTMASGKSTLALQLCWQLREGRSDVTLWTFGDRSAEGMVTSRIGIEPAAEASEPGQSLDRPVSSLVARGINILVIDEAQFASVAQIDELAR